MLSMDHGRLSLCGVLYVAMDTLWMDTGVCVRVREGLGHPCLCWFYRRRCFRFMEIMFLSQLQS